MADRVSVMSWLEGLTQDDWRQYHSDSEVQEIARSALALLREQEPIEPFHICIHGKKLRTLITNRYFIFCPYCGRRIKWNA